MGKDEETTLAVLKDYREVIDGTNEWVEQVAIRTDERECERSRDKKTIHRSRKSRPTSFVALGACRMEIAGLRNLLLKVLGGIAMAGVFLGNAGACR
jgi:hypothetical protein